MTNATDTNKTLGESMFAQCGYAQDAIDKRVSQVWHEIFEGPNKFYWENDEGLAYVMDTGNNDVRTEGMSYAMMIALQYDRKDVFDKLWGWVMRHMYMKDGHHAHYFAWSVEPDGTPNSNGPAPDGEEYFAMDLFLASRRWGDGEDIYEYSAWGREILRYCVHKGERYDGEPMWNPDNKLIKFIPETEWSDPSYHLPHFYEVFAEEADEEDRPFWHEAAAASRRYLQAACDERTGMNAEYADYDGKPHVDESNHWHFYSDAYRTAANIGLDAAWNGPTTVLASTPSTAPPWTRSCFIRSDSWPRPRKAHLRRCIRPSPTRSIMPVNGCACCGIRRCEPARVVTMTISSMLSPCWR